MLKKTITAILAMSLIIGGCATLTAPKDISDDQFVTIVQKDARETKADAQLAAAIYFGLIKDKDERVKTAKFAGTVAASIKDMVTNQDVTLAQLKTYAFDLISKSDDKNKVVVGAMLNAIAIRLEDKLDVQFSTSSSRKLEAGRQLILAAAEGILAVTQIENSPTTLPK